MLNHISTIWEYRDFLTIHKSHLDVSQLKLLKSKYRPALSKLLNLSVFFKRRISFLWLIIINEENRLNLKPVNLSIRMVYQSAAAITPWHMMDMTILVSERNTAVLWKLASLIPVFLHKHALVLTMEELFMLRTMIMSLGLKGLFPIVHLNGNLYTKIISALKESTMQY